VFVLLFEFCLFSVCKLFLVLIHSFLFCFVALKKKNRKKIDKKRKIKNRTFGEGVGLI